MDSRTRAQHRSSPPMCYTVFVSKGEQPKSPGRGARVRSKTRHCGAMAVTSGTLVRGSGLGGYIGHIGKRVRVRAGWLHRAHW
eukprot:995955-Prorocentrum_minimum.AAC.2